MVSPQATLRAGCIQSWRELGGCGGCFRAEERCFIWLRVLGSSASGKHVRGFQGWGGPAGAESVQTEEQHVGTAALGARQASGGGRWGTVGGAMI